jgi:hypothetical protein
MLEEMKSIEANNPWYLADLLQGRKHDEHGNIAKHKARLVVKGMLRGTKLILMKCLCRFEDLIQCGCS